MRVIGGRRRGNPWAYLALLLAIPLAARGEDVPNVPVFYTERAYRDEIQRLKSEIDRIREEVGTAPGMNQALYHTLENE